MTSIKTTRGSASILRIFLHHVSGIDAFEHIVCQPKNQKYHLGYFEGNMDQVLQDVETNRSDIGVLFSPATAAAPLSRMQSADIFFST